MLGGLSGGEIGNVQGSLTRALAGGVVGIEGRGGVKVGCIISVLLFGGQMHFFNINRLWEEVSGGSCPATSVLEALASAVAAALGGGKVKVNSDWAGRGKDGTDASGSRIAK